MDENINLVIEKLKQTLKFQKVLLACSTGVDSMVLLDLLRKSLDASQIVIAISLKFFIEFFSDCS